MNRSADQLSVVVNGSSPSDTLSVAIDHRSVGPTHDLHDASLTHTRREKTVSRGVPEHMRVDVTDLGYLGSLRNQPIDTALGQHNSSSSIGEPHIGEPGVLVLVPQSQIPVDGMGS